MTTVISSSPQKINGFEIYEKNRDLSALKIIYYIPGKFGSFILSKKFARIILSSIIKGSLYGILATKIIERIVIAREAIVGFGFGAGMTAGLTRINIVSIKKVTLVALATMGITALGTYFLQSRELIVPLASLMGKIRMETATQQAAVGIAGAIFASIIVETIKVVVPEAKMQAEESSIKRLFKSLLSNYTSNMSQEGKTAFIDDLQTTIGEGIEIPPKLIVQDFLFKPHVLPKKSCPYFLSFFYGEDRSHTSFYDRLQILYNRFKQLSEKERNQFNLLEPIKEDILRARYPKKVSVWQAIKNWFQKVKNDAVKNKKKSSDVTISPEENVSNEFVSLHTESTGLSWELGQQLFKDVRYYKIICSVCDEL